MGKKIQREDARNMDKAAAKVAKEGAQLERSSRKGNSRGKNNTRTGGLFERL